MAVYVLSPVLALHVVLPTSLVPCIVHTPVSMHYAILGPEAHARGGQRVGEGFRFHRLPPVAEGLFTQVPRR